MYATYPSVKLESRINRFALQREYTKHALVDSAEWLTLYGVACLTQNDAMLRPGLGSR